MSVRPQSADHEQGEGEAQGKDPSPRLGRVETRHQHGSAADAGGRDPSLVLNEQGRE